MEEKFDKRRGIAARSDKERRRDEKRERKRKDDSEDERRPRGRKRKEGLVEPETPEFRGTI